MSLDTVLMAVKNDGEELELGPLNFVPPLRAAPSGTTGDIDLTADPSPRVANQNLGFSATLATLTAESHTVALPGAVVGDVVQACPRAALPAGITIDYVRVSAANTVEVRIYNRSVGSVDCSGVRWDLAVVY